jgi:CubicO group peptidase (beta-lactamase class C family)
VGGLSSRESQRILVRYTITILAIIAVGLSVLRSGPVTAQSFEALQQDLDILPPGAAKAERVDLAGALRALHIPAASVALIENGRLAWSRNIGTASSGTIYQAASLSKLVSAVAALCLVERGALGLDRNVNDDLNGWRLPENDMTRGRPVTLRGLLSITAGISVPGYAGYEPGASLPHLPQILNGMPPANSQPVRVEAVPGSRYAYSGGGYEIVQALIEQKTRLSYQDALEDLVLRHVGMPNSYFLQPLPPDLAPRAAKGHYGDGRELAGGWRVIPELAAGGLWSSAEDLANLLIVLARAYRGESNTLLTPATARAMMTRQANGPYGLGGAVDGSGRGLVFMKRGQNVGYQGYTLIFPEAGQGIVVLTNSDNGTALATALIRRAAAIYRWPALGPLLD